MTQNIWPMLMAVAWSAGCGPQLTALGVAASSQAECAFGDDPPLLTDAVVLDLAHSDRLRLPVVFANDTGEPLTLEGFDMRWECTSDAFTAGLGPISVPRFSLDRPFCKDRRSDSADFVGFDVIPVGGPPVQPGQASIAFVEVIPAQVGQSLQNAIDLGIAADACLPHANEPVQAPECDDYVERLQALEPNRRLRVEEVIRWARFAALDGNHRLAEQSQAPRLGAGYRMQLRGVFVAGGAQAEPVSNELTQTVEICRNCGALDPGPPPTRGAREGFDCYYPAEGPR